jgi:hypothetical protein
MNNLLSYCGLLDARISTSENDLPVLFTIHSFTNSIPREFIMILDGCFQIHEIALRCCSLSILHCGLRFGDHLLKIGFSQDFKEARVQKSEKDCPIHTNGAQCNKCLYEARKRIIQQRCIDEKNGLRVSFPRSNGSGNSNTGFTFRYSDTPYPPLSIICLANKDLG